MLIHINLDESIGKMKPLHGVNNGPVCYGSLLNVSHHYRELGIPMVRLHDPNWPHPRECDIPQIFRDFSADPADPASYDFRTTDTYIKSILDTGAEVFYRLGVSIEHSAMKYYTHPPVDSDKWAQVCLGIIRHYNEGWADGFHYGIRYWEIWNEPDNGDEACMWSGNEKQYFSLYQAASTAIKGCFPDLKVGGYAATTVKNRFADHFLDYCVEHQLPLDFFSWHLYFADPGAVRPDALKIRRMLDERGYRQTESHLNEWNYFPGDWKRAFSRTGEEQYKRDLFLRLKGAEGAAYCAAMLSQLQQLPVDAACYYDGQPYEWFCGLFDFFGVPQKPFHVFKLFNELYRNYTDKIAVDCVSDSGGMYCCAGKNDVGALLVATNFNDQADRCMISHQRLQNGISGSVQCWLLDDGHDMSAVDHSLDLNGNIHIKMPAFSVAAVRVSF